MEIIIDVDEELFETMRRARDINFIEIKAYKCPFCNLFGANKNKIIWHSAECQNNPNYTQECLYCQHLIFNQRILSLNFTGPIPLCDYFQGCPYKNHTDKKLMEFIEKEKATLSQYGIIENRQGELVWKQNRGTRWKGL